MKRTARIAALIVIAAGVVALVYGGFSYTTETLIHAGQNGLTVAFVPVETNSATRPQNRTTSVIVLY